jgi:hypothetical protein
MSEILLINEVAKSNVASASGGGGATQYTGSDFVVSAATFPTHNVGNDYYTSGPSGFAQHSPGTFSITNAPWTATSSGTMYNGVRAFTVDQSSGAISVGSYSSYNIGTSDWFYGNWAIGVAGNTVCRWDTGAPYWRGYMRQYGISGTSVSSQSGGYTTSGAQTVWSSPIVPTFNGSTLTWNHAGYRDNTGTAHDFRWTGIGGSINSFPSTNDAVPGGSNTSTQCLTSVITNFGASYKGASSTGILRFYQQTSNSNAYISIMNSSSNNVNSFAQGDVLNGNAGPSTNAVGLDLSNGTQLYYVNTGDILLRNGSSLTNVTTQADWIPGILGYLSQSAPVHSYVALSSNKWMMLTTNTPNEVIIFSVNPSTYKVNIQNTALVTSGSGAPSLNTNSQRTFISGSTNQFLVFCGEANGHITINVAKNPLGGIS